MARAMPPLPAPTKGERKFDRRCLRELGLDPEAVHHALYGRAIHCALMAHPVLPKDHFMVAVGVLSTRAVEVACPHDDEKGAKALDRWARFQDIQRSMERWREAARHLTELERKHRERLREGAVAYAPENRVLYAM